MAKAQPRPTLAAHLSKYPIYGQARAYLKNFLRHGRRPFLRTKRYAYYRHSPTIQVIVIRLKPQIYEVRAYPVDGYYVATLEEALKVQDFRAWLFARDDRNRNVYYIIGSQAVGVEHYNQVKRAIKAKPTLALASRTY